MIELTIIGRTGNPEPGGACSCYLVRGEGATLVLDFGPGALSRLGVHQSPESVDAILISHMHQDHMLDLLPLTRTLRNLGALQPGGPRVKLLVPPGGNSTLRALGFAFAKPLEHMEGASDEEMKIQSVNLFTHFFDLAEHDPDRILRFGGLEVQLVSMRHVGGGFEPIDTKSKAFGMRITDGRAVLAYTGDTGDNPGLDVLARDADILLSEASMRDEVPDITGRHGHLTAAQAGRIAARNGVGRLILTHFVYPLPYNVRPYTYNDLVALASEEEVTSIGV